MSELDLSGLSNLTGTPHKKELSKNKKNNFANAAKKEPVNKKTYENEKNNQPNKSFKPTNQNENKGKNDSYVGAPYNFVPFYKEVVPIEDKAMLVRGTIDDELLSGEISYTIKAGTPIFVDDGTDKHEFYRNVYGKYAIPGSTMRGLIRTHAQILGFSGFDEDIDDYRLMYRKVGASKYDPDRDRYNDILGNDQILIQQGKKSKQVSILKHVKGGYIKNEKGKYYIYPTEVTKISENLEEMNYYVLSERHIQAHKDEKEFAYFEKNNSILQHDLSQEFVRTTDKWGKVHYKGTPNREYAPYYREISYEVKNLKNISAVGEKGKYKKEGYLVSTGKMNEKKAIYIIPKMIEEGRIELSDADVKAFLIDLKKKETTLRNFGGVDRFSLPKDGDKKPVFYIDWGGRYYFGYTPRLRLFYDHTIKEGYKQIKKEDKDKFDFAKSIFGCIGEKGSFKSKVSFSDVVLAAESARKEKEAKVILGEPKPSSYMDYLEQPRNRVTYNNDGFVLRGLKQYWLRNDIVESGTIKNDKVGSVIKGLSAGNTFRGKIRFQNMTKEELGLLLWSIKLEENSQINIGKAKAYGYGRCSISDVTLQILKPRKAYGLDESLDLNPFDVEKVDAYINIYKKAISEKLHMDVTAVKSVKTFFLMKDATIMPEANEIRYMSIDKKEYQNRKAPLQRPEDLVKSKKI